MTEEFKRPDHPDFWTSSERKQKEFSGVVHNSISDDMEMWIRGELVFSSTRAERLIDPNCFNRKHVEYFKLDPTR